MQEVQYLRAPLTKSGTVQYRRLFLNPGQCSTLGGTLSWYMLPLPHNVGDWRARGMTGRAAMGVTWSGAGQTEVAGPQPKDVSFTGQTANVPYIAPMDALYATFYIYADGGTVRP